ncbi:MAG: hypothetical protein RIT27_970 [Pseudomonadota bacterium]|jgi:uncharacterized secreted protein with C-terminal beta-propeller domain
MKRLLFLLWISLWNYQVFAWDITLNPVENTQMIWLKNTKAISQANVYLAWFDLDADKLLSFSVTKGWQNTLEPAFETPVDIPIFDTFPAATIPAVCPTEHRCFLAFVDVPNNTNVLEMEKWRNGAILPLSTQAAYERLPNQTFFLTKQQNNLLDGGTTVFAAAPSATETTTQNKTDTSSSTTTTEKPDIFRRENHNILFANSAANKFQIIDVSNVNVPKLKTETTLKGNPKEIYAINNFYLLMQEEEEKTRLTVFSTDQLMPVSEQIIDGRFLQSRRRNDVIFSVNQSYNQNGTQLQLNATLVDSFGHLSTIDSTTLQGYDPKIAIFPDYLVIANQDSQDWNNSVVTVFDLSQTKPLTSIGQIKVSGQIPSEFHLNVQNAQLRLVFGPRFNNAQGSTLAIYDLSKLDLPLIGKVEKIAPNEALFATRFVNDMAYVVTYQRKDPLWAIDLSNPKEPTIKGELVVPGWSELMFFNQNRLFAIGFDDQLANGESWARRVSASLFDVNSATDLKLINKITPLFGKTSYSYSQATSDERALLLDWEQHVAAFPLESWYNDQNSYLQILRFPHDKLEDAGLLELPLLPQRSLLLDQEKLGILSDQVFFTADINNNAPKLLGELELARQLQWLVKSPTGLMAAAQGKSGFYRLYLFEQTNLSKPLQTWSLSRNYSFVETNGKLAIFFNQNPLSIQVFDMEKKQLFPAQTLDSSTNRWFSNYFVDNERFYLSEQQYLDIQPLLGVNNEIRSSQTSSLWTLNYWQLEQGKMVAKKSINSAGQPIVVKENLIISQENQYSNNPRLNLLNFDEQRAKLVDSLTLDCRIDHYLLADNALYLICNKGDIYYYPTLMRSTSESFAPQIAEFSLLKVVVKQNHLQIENRWSLKEKMRVIGIANQTALLANEYYYGVNYSMAAVDYAMPYYSANSNCTVYRLETTQLTPLKTITNCNHANQTVLLEDKLFQTAGFSDIQQNNW